MSVATDLRSPARSVHEIRRILGPGGNRARVSETAKPVKSRREKPAVSPARITPRMSDAIVRKNGSVDSYCSTDSMSSSSSSSLSSGSAKTARYSRSKVRGNGAGLRSVKAVEAAPAVDLGPVKRCDWITANSDPLYMSFHDEEWGVPVRDDNKLYELLVLSIALAEHSWVSILSKREQLRSVFNDFDPASVAKFSDEKLPLRCKDGKALLSEPKLRAIVENAKQVLKVQEEFGSLTNYLWRFMNNQPTRNGHRYARQVPAKTPKAELISKDLMRRGFRCVGPTVVYSFMQASGMANDHLVSCFRYDHSSADPKKDAKPRTAMDPNST